MEKVRWGIISAGRISHTFAKDMAYASNAEIKAVAARNGESAQKFAEQYNIEKAYEGYDAVFNDTDIDAVYISTPHSLHFEQTQQALNAGKHVLCEKPFTVSPEQCIELTQLAKDKGLFLMEAMWTYFLPAIKQAQDWVEQGKIGELKHIKADFGYPLEYDPNKREWDVTLGGGSLLEMGIYPVAFNWLFTQRAPISTLVTGERAPNGADKDVTILHDYGKVKSVIGSSYQCRLRNWAYLIGTEGYIAIPDFFRASNAQLHVLDNLIDEFEDHRLGSGFEYQIEAASKAILNGELETREMPLSHTLAFQQQMAEALTKF